LRSPSPMPKKKPPDPGEKPQWERFVEAAKEVGFDESGEEFERAFKRIVPERRPSHAKRNRSFPCGHCKGE
jgi:hypothetical protein